MPIPHVSLRTLSGAYLRPRATAFAKRILAGKSKKTREVINGYLIDYSAVSVSGQARIYDYPMYVMFSGGVLAPDEPAPLKIAFPILRVVQGRDGLLIPVPVPVGEEETPVVPGVQSATASNGTWVASLGLADNAEEFKSAAVGLFNSTARPWSGGFTIHTYTLAEEGTGYSNNTASGFINPEDPELLVLVSIVRPAASSVPLVRRTDSNGEFIEGFEWDDAAFPVAPAGAGQLVVWNEYFEASLGGSLPGKYSHPWALALPFGGIATEEEGFTTELNWFFSALTMNSDNASRLGFSYFTALSPSEIDEEDFDQNVDLDVNSLGFFNPLSFSTLSQPQLIDPGDPEYDAVSNSGYMYNHFQPAYMAQVADDQVVSVMRLFVTRYENLSVSYQKNELFTIGIVRMSPTAITALDYVHQPASATETVTDFDYWLFRGLGMDSDGETAVYIGHHSGFPDTNPSFGDSRMGVLKITAAGYTQLDFFNLGFMAYVSNLASNVVSLSDVGLNGGPGQLQPPLDQVTYIGNGKFVFPVTEFADSDYATFSDTYQFTRWNLSVGQFNLADDSLTQIGRILDIEPGDFEHTYASLLDKSADVVSRIYCAKREEPHPSDPSTIVPAILLLSLGVAFSGGAYMDHIKAPGRTWISYDSGATWRLFANVGHGRGAQYVGGPAHRHTTEQPFNAVFNTLDT